MSLDRRNPLIELLTLLGYIVNAVSRVNVYTLQTASDVSSGWHHKSFTFDYDHATGDGLAEAIHEQAIAQELPCGEYLAVVATVREGEKPEQFLYSFQVERETTVSVAPLNIDTAPTCGACDQS